MGLDFIKIRRKKYFFCQSIFIILKTVLACCFIVIQVISVLCLWLLDLTKTRFVSLSLFNLIYWTTHHLKKDVRAGDLYIIKLQVSLNSRTHPHLVDVIYNIKEKL